MTNLFTNRIAQLRMDLSRMQVIERRAESREGFYVMADLDGFKAAQDAHPKGHAHGDWIISAFTRFLVRITRDTDRVSARFGGDEFIVWVPNADAAKAVQARIDGWRMGPVTATSARARTVDRADELLMWKKLKKAGKPLHPPGIDVLD